MKISSVLSVVIAILVLALALGGIAMLFSGMFLDTPTIKLDGTTIETSDVIISEVNGATKYEIFVDDQYVGFTVSEEFDLEKVLGLENTIEGGIFQVNVRAVREIEGSSPIVSDYSNTLEVTVAWG